MGKLTSTTAWFIADANVLIDYAKTSPEILGLVADHVGPVYVAAAVLDEVEQLDEAQCQAIGLTVVDGTLAQLTEASQRGGPFDSRFIGRAFQHHVLSRPGHHAR